MPGTARKEPKPKLKPRTSYMFPWLHRDVLKAVSDEIHATWVKIKDNHKDTNN
jgi:hypothetical protein